MDIEKNAASATTSSPRKAARELSLSVETPPPLYLQKQLSLKSNCLCSPTTHAGSFRCRHHRGSFHRSSSSSSSLAELANKAAASDDGNVNPQRPLQQE